MSAGSGLDEMLDAASVVVCCGTGGVGKTTTAAALAVRAVHRGRRVAVVTIDPARRLADALGLDDLADDCIRIDGPGPGELWASMLDTKATFDALIVRHAVDPAQAERILQNRYYRNLSTSLSGTREFMAMEKLYELHHDGRFDLVVVDTPPSRNALDFLEAPDLLSRFVEGRVFRLAVPRTETRRLLTAPLLVFLRRIAKVLSPEVVDDTLAFIEAFAGMEEGFRHRANAVDALLAEPSTAFVVVASPTAEAVEESTYLVETLATASIAVRALVVNRLEPRFTDVDTPTIERAAGGASGALRQQLDTLLASCRLADAEDIELTPLLRACASAAIARVEQLDHDVADLATISEVARRLG
jgi:anion-transporting  ArsA/GET3 family ATPase